MLNVSGHLIFVHISSPIPRMRTEARNRGPDESEKVGLKLNIQKTKIIASGPITSWEIDGKQCKQCQTLFFGARKSPQMVTAAMK